MALRKLQVDQIILFDLCIINKANHEWISYMLNVNNTTLNLSFTLHHAFLAHLSPRLTGELIGYRQAPGICRSPFCRCPHFSKIFFSDTPWPVKAKFDMKHL